MSASLCAGVAVTLARSAAATPFEAPAVTRAGRTLMEITWDVRCFRVLLCVLGLHQADVRLIADQSRICPSRRARAHRSPALHLQELDFPTGDEKHLAQASDSAVVDGVKYDTKCGPFACMHACLNSILPPNIAF